LTVPQDRQPAARAVPHSTQNFALGGLLVAQVGQVTRALPRSARPMRACP
jgi:hypothetical protein